LRCSFFPCKKMITLFKAEPFKVELAYAADDRIPAAYSRNLGTYSVALAKVRAWLGLLALLPALVPLRCLQVHAFCLHWLSAATV
jgi:hypothetical protein